MNINKLLSDRKKWRLVDVIFLKQMTMRKKMIDKRFDPKLFDKKYVKFYIINPFKRSDFRVTIRIKRKYVEEYIKLKEMKKIEFEGKLPIDKFIIQGVEGVGEGGPGGREGEGRGGALRGEFKRRETERKKRKEETSKISKELLEKFRREYGEEGAEILKKLAEVSSVSKGIRAEDVEKLERIVASMRSQIDELKDHPISYNLYEFKNTIKKVFGREIETAKVFIEFDDESYEIRYIIEDLTELSRAEMEAFKRLLSAIEETPGFIATIDEISRGEFKNKQELIEMYVVKWVNELWSILNIRVPSQRSKFKILVNILRHLVGYKHLNPLFYDKENIEDISYVEVGEPVRVRYRIFSDWLPVYMRGSGTKKIKPVTFNSIREANDFIRVLAQKAGQYVNVAMPMVNGRLPDNSRLHAKYSTTITAPEKGPTFTIRLKRERVILPLDLLLWRTVSPDIMAYAWMTVEVIPTASIVVAGSTGAGKTTTLQSILMFIPPSAKILSIEDTPELRLPHPHWEATYTLETTYSKNKITMFDLVKGALRERPDYIVVQEVRGSEAVDMFHAMASGHAALTTFHAKSFDEVINRFVNDPINVPKAFLASTLKQVWIQLIVPSDVPGQRFSRKVVEIWEVAGLDEKGNVRGYKLFYYDFITKRFYMTDAFARRLLDTDSILYQLIYQLGFHDPFELIDEFRLRKNFLMMLTYLYKVYTDKLIRKGRLTAEQNRVVDEVLEFWRRYEKIHNGDLAKMFFDILFEYRVSKDRIIKEVTELYSKVRMTLEDIVGVIEW